MVFIWRGLGWVVPMIIISAAGGSGLVYVGLTQQGMGAFANFGGLAAWALGAGMLWLLGASLRNDPYKHDFYFIPISYWGTLMMAFCVAIGIFMDWTPPATPVDQPEAAAKQVEPVIEPEPAFELVPPVPDPLPAKLDGVSFVGLHLTGNESQLQANLADFNAAGPQVDTQQKLSVAAEQWSPGPIYREVYLRQGDQLFHYDRRVDAKTEIPASTDEGILTSLRAIAYDTKRKRLLVSTAGPKSVLCAYDVTKRSWSVLRQPGLNADALTYVPDQDALYGLQPGDSGGFGQLSKFDPDGKRISTVTLPQTIEGERQGTLAADLHYVDPHVVVVCYTIGARIIDSTIHILDPSTGQSIYAGPLRQRTFD